ncbi:MAG: DUF134 domain-containing protein [Bacteroidales bacterium]|nr:DUF134 domain-containing protein [Bacteroidales bacterium]
MPRQARYRKVEYPPLNKGFVPIGKKTKSDEVVFLLVEEYEAVRLLDNEYMNQVDAAKRMEVSRPTLTRIYDSARKKLAQALVNSLRIEIVGGQVEFEHEWFRCMKCNTVFQVHDLQEKQECPNCKSSDLLHINDDLRKQPKRSHNYHRRNHKDNNNGFCVCEQCGKRISHKPGHPCRKMDCPDCDTSMTREGERC